MKCTQYTTTSLMYIQHNNISCADRYDTISWEWISFNHSMKLEYIQMDFIAFSFVIHCWIRIELCCIRYNYYYERYIYVVNLWERIAITLWVFWCRLVYLFAALNSGSYRSTLIWILSFMFQFLRVIKILVFVIVYFKNALLLTSQRPELLQLYRSFEKLRTSPQKCVTYLLTDAHFHDKIQLTLEYTFDFHKKF